MSLPPQFLEELRTRVPLADYLGRHVRIIRSGMHTKACCPFHQEKSPSFVIYPDHYHCFGCGAHGDVISFAMQHERLSFPDAVEKLAREAGLQVPTQSPQDVAAQQRQSRGHEALTATKEFFRASLHGEALQYLRDRQLDEEIIHRFALGYAPADGQALIKHLRAQGFGDDVLVEFGIAKKSERDSSLYSFFRDRVMFPVTDRAGRTVAFGGRILPGRPESAKYINSSDHPLFTKGRLLYNLPAARQAALDGQTIVVVEGYMDVITCAAAGLAGAVAPLGTAMTEMQLQLLWALLPKHGGRHVVPLICFDGDSAGRTAASRALDRILPHLSPEQSARFAFLPQGEDPDSLIKKGGLAGFQDVLAQSVSPAQWLWDRAVTGQDFTAPEARAALRRRLREECAEIKDRDTRAQYEADLNTRFEKVFPTATSQPSGARGPYSGKFQAPSVKPSAQGPTGDRKLRVLIVTLINHPALLDDTQEFLAHQDCADPRLSALQQDLAATPVREPGALRAELHAAGHTETLDALWQDAQLRLSKFAFDPQRGEDAAAFVAEMQG